MRYLMMIVGLAGIGFGCWLNMMGPPNVKPGGEFYILLGVIFLALGFATVDLVEAIKSRQ